MTCGTTTNNEIKEELTGFNFENAIRNKNLLQHADKNGKKLHLPSAMKTGTTICGVVFKDGVVLGADTRATSGSEVCDKNCEKIHYMAPNIWCCGAGTAADTEKTTEMISSQLDLLRLQTDSESRVVSACTLLKRMLFRYQGHVSAALVLGGVDVNGAHLYSIHPHGSIDKGPYVTMGSGSLAAMAVFEADFEKDMDEEAAIKLVKRAIFGGIFNDLGSGSNCDITIIRKSQIPEPVTRIRGYEKPNEVGPLRAQVQRPKQFTIPRGATEVLSSTFVPSQLVVEEATPMVL